MDETRELVKQDYIKGMRAKEIVEKYGLSENTLKSWIRRGGWAAEKNKAPKKKKMGAPKGNKNALGAGAPKGNRNAVKHGLFARCMPDEESCEIFDAVDSIEPLDLLWGNIKLLQTAILRSQKIMYVQDAEDKTKELVMDGADATTYSIQQAWDKQSNFLSALSRAQAELRNLIKQYDEMLHKNWELATEEQKARLALVQAQTDKLTGNNMEIEDLSEIEGEIYGSQ